MQLIKMFGLAALAAMAAMAFVGATSASALSTQLCLEHNETTGLLCPTGKARTHLHRVLEEGTVFKLLSPISILCLGVLSETTPLGLVLNGPQEIHTLELVFTGCGTGSAHNNCTITTEELPLAHLLKIGLNQGVLLLLTGRLRLQCSNLGIDCVFDLEGTELSAEGDYLTAEEAPTTELGGKFVCPNEGFVDLLLRSLLPVYILG